MEDEKIEAVKNWLEPKSIQDIQVFIGFTSETRYLNVKNDLIIRLRSKRQW